jgi:hypothetical protein
VRNADPAASTTLAEAYDQPQDTVTARCRRSARKPCAGWQANTHRRAACYAPAGLLLVPAALAGH